MTKQKSSPPLAKRLSLVLATVIILMPYHALISTWAGSNFGHLDLFRIWKELLIVAISPTALWLLLKDKGSLKTFFHSTVVRLFIFYILIHAAIGYWAITTHQVNANALIYGLIINLRYIWFFILCAIAARYSGFLHQNWQKILILPSLPVIGFGILQKLILPVNFLAHFGYGSKTIPAYQTVDANINFQRVQSTLRGANPFGAYLILPLTAFRYWRASKRVKYLAMTSGFIAIFYSYSRSAWIGLMLALLMSIYLALKRAVNYKLVTWSLAAILALAVILSYGLKNNQSFQDVFFHTSNSSTSAKSSNSVRLSALKTATQEVINQPLGGGPGTAGPASFRNIAAPRIAENYYIQIAQEVGFVGLTIFLAINWIVVASLWRFRNNDLAKVLLASFIGISFINLVSHAWTDDTLSLIWWGLAGVAASPAILQKRDNAYAKQ